MCKKKGGYPAILEGMERNLHCTPWPANFPRVVAMSSGVALQNHPLHALAKAGDMDAAARLVLDLAKPDKIRMLAAQFPDAVIVPVHAQEASGINHIPRKFADYIAHLTGLEADTDVIQATTVFRTGKGGWYRMAFRPEFDGPVRPGREHILVDDCVTGGGSLSELRQHIIRGGGNVVAMSTIGYAQFSTNIALTENTRNALTIRYNGKLLYDWLQQHNIYNGEVGALTESEARLIYNAKSLNTATERLSEAKQQEFAASQPELFPKRSRQEEIEALSAHRVGEEISKDRQAVLDLLMAADREDHAKGNDNEHSR